MIKVLHAGLFSTFQDIGRFYMAKYAVPQSGVMDQYSAKQANLLLQNHISNAVLEISLQGPKLQFEVSTQVACTGLAAQIELNSNLVSINQLIHVKPGDVLHIKRVIDGNYVYLAVQNGFDLPKVFNSFSYYKGIAPSSLLKTKDVLRINSSVLTKKQTATYSHVKFDLEQYASNKIDVSVGPEFEYLTAVQKRQLFLTKFHVSKFCNRMGFQLEERFKNDLTSIITSTVIPGTVQLTPDGMLIVLMKDAQTTGGYPRVLQLTEQAIFILAQKRSKETFQFRKI